MDLIRKQCNKHNAFSIILILFLVVIVCCTKNKPTHYPIIEIIPDTIESKKLSTLVSDYYFIKLETDSACLIGNIDKLIIKDSTICILDKTISKAIFIFDIEGKFKYKIQNIGKGIGEYIQPQDFIVDTYNETIELYDAAAKRIIIYNLRNGDYITHFNIGYLFVFFEKIDQDKYILQTRKMINRYDNQILSYDLLIVKNTGELLDKYFKYNPELKSNNRAVDLTRVFTQYNGHILISKLLFNEIYEYKLGVLCPKYVFEYGKFQVPKKFKILNTDEILDKLTSETKYAWMHMILAETDRYLVFIYGYKQVLKLPNYDLNKPIVGFYDKRNECTYQFTSIDDDIHYLGQIIPVTNYKEYLVSIINPYEYFTKKVSNNSNNILKIFTKCRPYDNPILFFYNIDFTDN